MSSTQNTSINAPSASTSSPAPSTAASSAPASASAPTGITSVAKPSGKQTKLVLQTSLQALVSGLQATFQPTDTFVLRGATVSRDDVIGQVNGYLAMAEGTKTARNQWRTAVQTEQAGLADLAPVRQAIRSALQSRYGRESSELTTFGFSPARAVKKTVASKAAAAAKTAATRKARNTMGSAQRKTVKGDVVGLEMTPLVAGTPQPAGSAAATASNGTTGTNGAIGSASSPSVTTAAPAASVPAASGH